MYREAGAGRLRLRRRTVGDVFGKEVYKAGQRKFNFNEFRGQVEGYGKVFL